MTSKDNEFNTEGKGFQHINQNQAKNCNSSGPVTKFFLDVIVFPCSYPCGLALLHFFKPYLDLKNASLVSLRSTLNNLF